MRALKAPAEANASGVKSVGQAIHILNVVAKIGGPVTLKQIAAEAGVVPSKAHRYVQSLCDCGLLSQASKSGAYDLGMETLRLGLAAINRVDIVNRAGDALPELVSETEADGFLTVWGEVGPTVVRFERSLRPAVAMLGAGVSVPALNSATGEAYLAFANPERTNHVVRREAGDGWQRALKDINTKLEKVREAGYAYSIGLIMPDRQCIAAPIISFDDHVMAVISLVSIDKKIIEPDGEHVKKLLAFCRRHSVSKRGYMEETLIEKRISV